MFHYIWLSLHIARLYSNLQRPFVEAFQYASLKYVILRPFVSSFVWLLLTPVIRKTWCQQFSNLGSLEQHGFARNRFWTIDTDPPPFPTGTPPKAFVDLILKPTDEDLKIWPQRCRVGSNFYYWFLLILSIGLSLLLYFLLILVNMSFFVFYFTVLSFAWGLVCHLPVTWCWHLASEIPTLMGSPSPLHLHITPISQFQISGEPWSWLICFLDYLVNCIWDLQLFLLSEWRGSEFCTVHGNFELAFEAFLVKCLPQNWKSNRLMRRSAVKAWWIHPLFLIAVNIYKYIYINCQTLIK